MVMLASARLEGDSLMIFGGAERLDLQYLRTKIYSRPEYGVILSGTIVEGIGNRMSDFDVYVICEKRPRMEDVTLANHHWVYSGDDNSSVTTKPNGDLFQLFDYVQPGNFAWDVEYWTVEDANRLIAGLSTAYRDLQRHAFRSSTFSYKQAGFLHKILNGIVLQDNPTLQAILRDIRPAELCYVLYRQHAGGYPAFRDIAGAWHAGDWDLAAFAAREHVFDQVLSLTFLEKLTNPNMKWISRKVKDLPAPSSHIRDGFEEFVSSDLSSAEGKREYVLKGLRLIDHVYERGRTLLDAEPTFMSTRTALELTVADKTQRPAENRELDRQLAYRTMMYKSGGLTAVELLFDCANQN